MTAAPPVTVGALQETVAEALPTVAVTVDGAPGVVAGVAAAVVEAAEVPEALIAFTVKV